MVCLKPEQTLWNSVEKNLTFAAIDRETDAAAVLGTSLLTVSMIDSASLVVKPVLMTLAILFCSVIVSAEAHVWILDLRRALSVPANKCHFEDVCFLFLYSGHDHQEFDMICN